jgi:hypothetical protein
MRKGPSQGLGRTARCVLNPVFLSRWGRKQLAGGPGGGFAGGVDYRAVQSAIAGLWREDEPSFQLFQTVATCGMSAKPWGCDLGFSRSTLAKIRAEQALQKIAFGSLQPTIFAGISPRVCPFHARGAIFSCFIHCKKKKKRYDYRLGITGRIDDECHIERSAYEGEDTSTRSIIAKGA